MSNICKWAWKLPQNSIFLALPLPGILLPVDPGGFKRYEWHFWTPACFCDLGQQVYLYTKTILVPRRCWTFENYDSVLRSLPPSSLICAIYIYMGGLALMVISPKNWECFPWFMYTLGIIQPHLKSFSDFFFIEATHNMQKYDQKSFAFTQSNQIQTFLSFELTIF